VDEITARYGMAVEKLVRALERRDKTAFFVALDEVMRVRDAYVMDRLDELTLNLQSALERFCTDSRLVDLAEKEVPDAHVRLERVLEMTDTAAHRTLDLIEDACPPADRIGRRAGELLSRWRAAGESGGAPRDPALRESVDTFLAAVQHDAGHVHRNLKEVLLTQEYQDLSGQIIRGVMDLIAELEEALRVLVTLTHRGSQNRGSNETVPAVGTLGDAVGQSEIDSLLSSFEI